MRYEKLVRDRIPEIIHANGEKAMTRHLLSEEFVSELKRKLQEELDEFLRSGNVEELADILEVVYAIAAAAGADPTALDSIRLSKLRDRGGFANRTMLIETVSPHDS